MSDGGGQHVKQRYKGISEDHRAFEDERGHLYPFRPFPPPQKLLWKLADTVVRSAMLAGILVLIGLTWEAFH